MHFTRNTLTLLVHLCKEIDLQVFRASRNTSTKKLQFTFYHGRSVVRRISNIKEAEQEETINISLDSRIQTDISLINGICFYQSDKILYEMMKGVEDSLHTVCRMSSV